jgi:hypothetical protein
LASASARPQRSEDSQVDGRPRPAPEGIQASLVMGSPLPSRDRGWRAIERLAARRGGR